VSPGVLTYVCGNRRNIYGAAREQGKNKSGRRPGMGRSRRTTWNRRGCGSGKHLMVNFEAGNLSSPYVSRGGEISTEWPGAGTCPSPRSSGVFSWHCAKGRRLRQRPPRPLWAASDQAGGSHPPLGPLPAPCRGTRRRPQDRQQDLSRGRHPPVVGRGLELQGSRRW